MKFLLISFLSLTLSVCAAYAQTENKITSIDDRIAEISQRDDAASTNDDKKIGLLTKILSKIFGSPEDVNKACNNKAMQKQAGRILDSTLESAIQDGSISAEDGAFIKSAQNENNGQVLNCDHLIKVMQAIQMDSDKH